jgi:hypothetical protein
MSERSASEALRRFNPDLVALVPDVHIDAIIRTLVSRLWPHISFISVKAKGIRMYFTEQKNGLDLLSTGLNTLW